MDFSGETVGVATRLVSLDAVIIGFTGNFQPLEVFDWGISVRIVTPQRCILMRGGVVLSAEVRRVPNLRPLWAFLFNEIGVCCVCML